MRAVTKNYASALLEVAEDRIAFYSELQQVAVVVSSTKGLKLLLTDLAVRDRQTRKDLLESLFGDFSLLSQKLLDGLIVDGALRWLDQIVPAYLQLLRETEHVLVVEVETPQPLQLAERTALLDKLRRGGQQVLLTERVRPELIAGINLIIDDVEHAHSIGGLLTELQYQLA